MGSRRRKQKGNDSQGFDDEGAESFEAVLSEMQNRNVHPMSKGASRSGDGQAGSEKGNNDQSVDVKRQRSSRAGRAMKNSGSGQFGIEVPDLTQLFNPNNWRAWAEQLRQRMKKSMWGTAVLVGIVVATLGLFVLKAREEAYGFDSMFRTDEQIDYYKILELPPSASNGDIKRSFRHLSKVMHPDKNPGCTDCKDKYAKITEAYSILGDPVKRKFYDKTGGGRAVVISSSTRTLSKQEYMEMVKDSSEFWVVQIYRDNDIFCKEFSLVWEEVAVRYSEYASFCRVNAETDKGILSVAPINIRFFPTVYALAPSGEHFVYNYCADPSIATMQNFIEQSYSNYVKIVPYLGTPPEKYSVIVLNSAILPLSIKKLALKYRPLLTVYAMHVSGVPLDIQARANEAQENIFFLHENNCIMGLRLKDYSVATLEWAMAQFLQHMVPVLTREVNKCICDSVHRRKFLLIANDQYPSGRPDESRVQKVKQLVDSSRASYSPGSEDLAVEVQVVVLCGQAEMPNTPAGLFWREHVKENYLLVSCDHERYLVLVEDQLRNIHASIETEDHAWQVMEEACPGSGRHLSCVTRCAEMTFVKQLARLIGYYVDY